MKRYEVLEYANGTKEWYLNGELHRLDGPAIEHADGSKYWYQSGKLHRLDGPAIEYDSGDNEWWQHGKRHRLDGPAIEWVNGSNLWYIDGKPYDNPSKYILALPNYKSLTIEQIENIIGYRLELFDDSKGVTV